MSMGIISQASHTMLNQARSLRILSGQAMIQTSRLLSNQCATPLVSRIPRPSFEVQPQWQQCMNDLRPLSTSSSRAREDRLFKRIELELRAHQPAVLKSYSWFIEKAAKELDVPVVQSEGEPEPHKTRKTLLRSAFVHSKHRVQYEMRTYYWLIVLEKLTESTKDTFLEYIQRNLPEGVAMKVNYHEMKRLPSSIYDSLRDDIDKSE